MEVFFLWSHVTYFLPFIKDLPYHRGCYNMGRKSCNEDILSKDSDNYFLGLNYLRSITFQPGAQYFAVWTLALFMYWTTNYYQTGDHITKRRWVDLLVFCFCNFCTEVQGDLRTDVLGGYITFSVPDHTHRLTGQPQHQELHALLFSNSVWIL